MLAVWFTTLWITLFLYHFCEMIELSISIFNRFSCFPLNPRNIYRKYCLSFNFQFYLLWRKMIIYEDSFPQNWLFSCCSLSRGLMCLHRMKIIHRDLKSANCLVNKHWTVKICDFGLSRIFVNVPVTDSSSAGTPEWMAPELIRNEPFSEKCDIFSLGVIMWELCTLNKPWEGTPPERVMEPAILFPSTIYNSMLIILSYSISFSLFCVLFRLSTLLRTRGPAWRYLKGHWVVWLQVFT